MDGETLFFMKRGDLHFLKTSKRRAQVEDVLLSAISVSKPRLVALLDKYATNEEVFSTIALIDRNSFNISEELSLISALFAIKLYFYCTDFDFDPAIGTAIKDIEIIPEETILQKDFSYEFDIIEFCRSVQGREILSKFFMFMSHLVACKGSFCYHQPKLLARGFAASIFKDKGDKKLRETAIKVFIVALKYQVGKKRTYLTHKYQYNKENLPGEELIEEFKDVDFGILKLIRGTLVITNFRLVWYANVLEIPERDEKHIPIASITNVKCSKRQRLKPK